MRNREKSVRVGYLGRVGRPRMGEEGPKQRSKVWSRSLLYFSFFITPLRNPSSIIPPSQVPSFNVPLSDVPPSIIYP